MKTTRQEKLKSYLTEKKRFEFKNKDGEFMVYDCNNKEWLPCVFKKSSRKKGVRYFSNRKLEEDVLSFLESKEYHNINRAEIKGLIKLIPIEIN